MSARAKRIVAWVALVIVAAFLVGRSQITAESLSDNVGETRRLAHKVDAKVNSLQGAIVESCRVNGNARATVTRETLHEEIEDAEHPDPALVKELGISQATLERLTAETVAKLQDRLDRVKLTPCASQYRISPGSGARRRSKP